MFELDDSKNSMCKGDFRLKLDYQFVLKNVILPNKSVNHSADLFVEADNSQSCLYRRHNCH